MLSRAEEKPRHDATVRGVFDAIAAGVASALVDDRNFVERLSGVIADLVVEKVKHDVREKFVRADDLEAEISSSLESFAESRDFERAVADAVDAAFSDADIDKQVEEAMRDFEVEADSVKGLDDYVTSFIEDRVAVKLEVK